MSQYNFRNIREVSNSPLEKEVSDIAKKVAAAHAKAQLDLLDDKEDKFPSGVDDDVAVKFNDQLAGVHQLFFDRAYYVTFEPDHNFVSLMLPGKALGNELRDYSGFGNHAFFEGEPILVDGAPFDPGIYTHGTKSVAVRFNRPTSPAVNEERLRVPNSVNLQVTSLSTAICFMIRVRPWSLVNQGGLNPTLFEKIDDNTPNNGYMLQLEDNGRLVFFMLRGGVLTAKETGSGVIQTGRPYTIWVTFTTGGTVKIYTRDETTGVETDHALINSGAGANWQSDKTEHSLWILKRGAGSAGYVYCDYYDMRIYKGRLVSATEVDHHFENCYTIYDRPKGHLMITNHWTLGGILAIESSYSSDSYSTLSYNT